MIKKKGMRNNSEGNSYKEYKSKKILNSFLKVFFIILGIWGKNIYALDFEQTSLSSNSTDISVFVSIDPNNPNPSTVNLYHDVITNIRRYYSNRWNIIKSSDVIRYIDSYKNEDSNILKSVLYIDRKDFLLSKEKKEPIAVLQYVMESFAIDDAIVVDCVAGKDSLVTSCGLYVYSRIKKRFTVAVEKMFTSPISDISSWGKILVDRLVYNIRNVEEENTQLKLNKLLDDGSTSEEEEDSSRIEVGTRILKVKSYIKSLYGFSLGVIFHDIKENTREEGSSDIASINKFGFNNIYYGLRASYDFGYRSSLIKESYLSIKIISVPVGIKYRYKNGIILSTEIALGLAEILSWNTYKKDNKEGSKEEGQENKEEIKEVKGVNFKFSSSGGAIRYKKRALMITPRIGVGYDWGGFRLDGFIEYSKFIKLSSDIRKKSRNIDHYVGGGIVGSLYF